MKAAAAQRGAKILANIYLHYTLDLWVERVVRKECKGEVVYQRYADDFVLGFEYGHEAERIFKGLGKALSEYRSREERNPTLQSL